MQSSGKKMGEILVSQGLISDDQFQKATQESNQKGIGLSTALIRFGFMTEDALAGVLGEQVQISKGKLTGEVLIEQGLITSEQLQSGLEHQKQSGKKIGRCLVELGFISEDKLIEVLSAHLDIPHVILENFTFSQKLLRMIPLQIVQKYRAIPLFESNGVITVAMADPTNRRNIDHLKIKTGKDIEPVIASEKSILAAIEGNYLLAYGREVYDFEGGGRSEDTDIIAHPHRTGFSVDKDDPKIRESIKKFIVDAMNAKATAVHIEPVNESYRLLYRINNMLVEQKPISLSVQKKINFSLKAIAGIRIVEGCRPQQGYFQLSRLSRKIDVEVSTFPVIITGYDTDEKIVLQFCDQKRESLNIYQLGILPGMLEQVLELINRRDGIILFVGPAGSGKKTTFYAVCRYLMDIWGSTKSMLTIENPIREYIRGAVQSEINTDEGYGFAPAVYAALRQDPDIIMIDHIDSAKTFQAAAVAALSGHCVFSTVDAPDAAAVYSSLITMGVAPYLITKTVKGVLNQRLVNRICGYCKEVFAPEPRMLKKAGLNASVPLYRGNGCGFCNSTGFNKRIGLFELYIPGEYADTPQEPALPEKDPKSPARHTEGAYTLRSDALHKLLGGLTTIEQVIKALHNE